MSVTPELFAVFVLENAKHHLLDRDRRDTGWWILESAQWAIIWQMSGSDLYFATTLVELSRIRRSIRDQPSTERNPLLLPKDTDEKKPSS